MKLGYFINQDGQRYATVYSVSTPEADKEELRTEYRDAGIFQQLAFCTPEYFRESEEAGMAESL